MAAPVATGTAARRRHPLTLRLLYRLYRAYSAVNYWFRQRFSAAGVMVLAGLPVTAAMGLDTNQAATYQLFCFLVVVVGLALILGRFSRPRVTVRRQVPEFATAGETIGYWLTVENGESRVQRSLSVRELFADSRPDFDTFATTPEPGEDKRNYVDRFFRFYRWTWLSRRGSGGVAEEAAVPDLPVRGQCEVRMALTPERRGVIRLRGIAVYCPEPFGLYRSPVVVADAASILVLPKRYRLPPLRMPGSVRYQQGGVSLASSVGESEEFASLRDYRRGDPLSRIHWKSWAKAGKPIVREYQQEYFARHALVLDTIVADAHHDCFEEAVSVAASFACTVESRESLLDLLFLGTRAHCFTAGRGVAHPEQMLELLATVKPCADHGFDDLARLVLAHAPKVGSCICLFVEWDDARRNLMRRLQQAGVPVMVFVVRPEDGPELDRSDLHLGSEDSFTELTVGAVEEELQRL